MNEQIVRPTDPPSLDVDVLGHKLPVTSGDRLDPRLDVVTVEHHEDNAVTLWIQQGTPSWPPMKPPIPEGHIELAVINVPTAAVTIFEEDISNAYYP